MFSNQMKIANVQQLQQNLEQAQQQENHFKAQMEVSKSVIFLSERTIN